MLNWKAIANVLVSALVVGGGAALTSAQANPLAPWQSHAAVGGAAALGALANHLRGNPFASQAPKP